MLIHSVVFWDIFIVRMSCTDGAEIKRTRADRFIRAVLASLPQGQHPGVQDQIRVIASSPAPSTGRHAAR